MAMGCARLRVHDGVIMMGSFCTSARIISKLRLPDPMTMDARSSQHGGPSSRKMRPTSLRLARWADRASPAGTRPPR